MNDFVQRCKSRAQQEMERFFVVLSFVPEDKLTWRPAPTAKTALQIAAHCAGYSGAFAEVIRTGAFPSTVDAFLAPIHQRIEAISSREQAEAVLRKGIEETVAALDNVKPEQIESRLETPGGSMPYWFFMTIPAEHLTNHIGQLDYLQTCWDDQEVHF